MTKDYVKNRYDYYEGYITKFLGLKKDMTLESFRQVLMNDLELLILEICYDTNRAYSYLSGNPNEYTKSSIVEFVKYLESLKWNLKFLYEVETRT